MDIKNFDSRFVALAIKEIVQENENTRTFVFEYPLGSEPGQFVMLWIPGVDEKPFSVAYDDGKEFWLTICRVGAATEELFKLNVGDRVGIRGPLGTKYRWKSGERLAVVSGGYGAAPMYFVARKAVEDGCEIEFLTGARSEDLLLYLDRVEGMKGVNVAVSTDDGSKGHHGYVTQVLDQVLAEKKIDRVFSCGPELMMKAAGEVAASHGVPAWLSMEKYMKCGIGVCGQCSLDDSGDLVCLQGPVMSYDLVKGLPEFGNYHRDAQGQKHYFKSSKK